MGLVIQQISCTPKKPGAGQAQALPHPQEWARGALITGFGLVLLAGSSSVYLAMRGDEMESLVRDSFELRQSATAFLSDLNTLAAGRSLMQSAELYSHPLRVLDVEARLGAPPVQTSALQLLLQPILLRVPVRNGVGDVVHF